jgi:CBS domain-containing protein
MRAKAMQTTAPARPTRARDPFWAGESLLRHCEGFVVDSNRGRLGMVAGVATADTGDVELIVEDADGVLRISPEDVRSFDPHAQRIVVAGRDGVVSPTGDDVERLPIRRGLRVADLMTRDVVVVTPSTPLRATVRLLVERRIAGVPVCDATGAVVGVVSEADILARGRGADRRAHGAHRPPLEARTAGEAMSSPAVTIDSGRSVSDAARLMLERRVNRLPVVDDGRLVGIVARSDLVRAFDRSDEELLREICDGVLLGWLWIDPSPIEIEVVDGVVTLCGRVASEPEHGLVVSHVQRVPGVVAVDATELRWRRGARAV